MKATRWWYVVAGLLGLAALVLGVGIFVSVAQVASDYPATLTRVRAPGSADIQLSSAGNYVLYFEYRSVVDGDSYVASATPPFTWNLVPLDSAAPLVRTSQSCTALQGKTHGPCQDRMYSTGRYAGRSLEFFSVPTVGDTNTYRLTMSYTNGQIGPPTVLTIGKDSLGESLIRTIPNILLLLTALGAAAVVGALNWHHLQRQVA